MEEKTHTETFFTESSYDLAAVAIKQYKFLFEDKVVSEPYKVAEWPQVLNGTLRTSILQRMLLKLLS